MLGARGKADHVAEIHLALIAAETPDVFHSLQIGLLEDLDIIHTSWMDASVDPYARLATLLWILKPADVVRLADVADGLAEERLATFLGSARSEPV